MSAYFFDSSAIVKRYVNERGSAWVAATTDPNSGARVYVASITAVEVVAAFARKRRASVIFPLMAAAAVSQFQDHYAHEYRIIPITDPIIARAMAIAEAHALRGYDAVQLGAALEISARRRVLGGSALTLVTSDDEMLGAAAAEGLVAENPNIH